MNGPVPLIWVNYRGHIAHHPTAGWFMNRLKTDARFQGLAADLERARRDVVAAADDELVGM